MVVLVENLQCEVGEDKFLPRAWHPMKGRKLDPGEELIRGLLESDNIPHMYERRLLPLGYIYRPPEDSAHGQVVVRGMCPDFYIPGDERYAEQYIEITRAKKAAFKRRRIRDVKSRYPDVVITLVDREELKKIEADPQYLYDLLMPASSPGRAQAA